MTDAFNRLSNDLAEGYDDVTRGIARMTRHLQADAGSAVSESADVLVRAASDLARTIRRESGRIADRTHEEIREHPIATAAMAAALAGLLGYVAASVRQGQRKTVTRA